MNFISLFTFNIYVYNEYNHEYYRNYPTFNLAPPKNDGLRFEFQGTRDYLVALEMFM